VYFCGPPCVCCVDIAASRAVYDAETGHRVDWKCPVNQQQITETVHIPVRNVARERALTTAARMVVCLYTSSVKAVYTRCQLKKERFLRNLFVCVLANVTTYSVDKLSLLLVK